MNLNLNEFEKNLIWNFICNNEFCSEKSLSNEINSVRVKSYIEKANLISEFNAWLKKDSNNKSLISLLQFKNSRVQKFRSMRSISHYHEGIELSKKLCKENIRHVFLKGLTNIAKRKNCLRDIRDIDILIDVEHLDKSIAIMHKDGYKFQNDVEYTYDLVSSKYDMYELPKLIKGNLIVEFHYRILTNKDEVVCDLSKMMFQDDTTTNVFGEIIKTPNVEHSLIHYIYHASSKGFFDTGIKSIYDIFCILRNHQIDISSLLHDAKKVGLYKEVSLFMQLAKRELKINLEVKNHEDEEQKLDTLKALFLLPVINKKLTQLSTQEGLKNKLKFLYRLIFVEKPLLDREFGKDRSSFFFYLKRWARQYKSFFKDISFIFFNQNQLRKKAELISKLSD